MDELRKELGRRRKNELFVTHYDHFYGAKYPIWLAIEVTTFSQLFKLFLNLKNKHKSKILTSKNEWLSFITKLEALVEEYNDSIELEYIGFPLNWKDLLKA